MLWKEKHMICPYISFYGYIPFKNYINYFLWNYQAHPTVEINFRNMRLTRALSKHFLLLVHDPHHVYFNTLGPRKNGRHLPDNIFKCIFMNENVWISKKISLKFVLKGLINNIPELVQIMAWCRPGDKPLSESMIVNLLMHICVTWPQWVNGPKQILEALSIEIYYTHPISGGPLGPLTKFYKNLFGFLRAQDPKLQDPKSPVWWFNQCNNMQSKVYIHNIIACTSHQTSGEWYNS